MLERYIVPVVAFLYVLLVLYLALILYVKAWRNGSNDGGGPGLG